MKHNFKFHLNPVFIETGSYAGDGIKAALRAGFKKIISIEVNSFYYNICKERYPQSNVHLILGDSATVLAKVLEDIDERCTFWLDAHYMDDINTAGGIMPVPLMEELKAIKNHHIKNHTILIDDMRLIRNKENGEWKDYPYYQEDIEKFIYEINPDYIISYVAGLVSQDILIAKI